MLARALVGSARGRSRTEEPPDDRRSARWRRATREPCALPMAKGPTRRQPLTAKLVTRRPVVAQGSRAAHRFTTPMEGREARLRCLFKGAGSRGARGRVAAAAAENGGAADR